MMELVTKHCLFCGEREALVDLYPQTFGESDISPGVFSARRSTDHLHYRIVRCNGCGLVFSREVLPADRIAQLYAGSAMTYGEYTQTLRADYWRPLKPYEAMITGGKALEIGCGNGFFLEELLDHGVAEVVGCEPSLDARNAASVRVRAGIRPGLFRDGMFSDRQFRLICSFHTIDHMDDPGSAVRITRTLLEPGGLVYIVAHDVESLQARLLRERSPVIDVEHIYLFNRTTLRRLFEAEGFVVKEVARLRNSYPLRYWVSMFPARGKRWAIFRGAIGSTAIGSVPVPLKAGNIYLIAQRT
jgi:SAM-dependent methyltransferase